MRKKWRHPNAGRQQTLCFWFEGIMGKISGNRILRSRPNTMLGRWRGSWGLRGRGGGGDKMWTHHWSNQEKDALCRGAGVCWGHVTPVWPVAVAPPAGPPACWRCPDGQCSSELRTGSPLQRATTRRGGGETHKDQATKRKKRKKEQEREKKHRKTEGGREKKNNVQPKVMTFSFQGATLVVKLVLTGSGTAFLNWRVVALFWLGPGFVDRFDSFQINK